MKKIFKYSFFSFALLLTFISFNSTVFASTNVVYNNSTSATYTSTNYTRWFYFDAEITNEYVAFSSLIDPNVATTLNSSSVPMLSDNSTMPLRVYEWTTNTSEHMASPADPDFDGVLGASINAHDGVFTDYDAPTEGLGIPLFKTGEGAYTSSSWLSQLATALQTDMGDKAFGPIIAIVGALIVTFAIVINIIILFEEAKENKKKKKL